jgi:hypothetical protein
VQLGQERGRDHAEHLTLELRRGEKWQKGSLAQAKRRQETKRSAKIGCLPFLKQAEAARSYMYLVPRTGGQHVLAMTGIPSCMLLGRKAQARGSRNDAM